MGICNVNISRLKKFTLNESDSESITLQLGGTTFTISYSVINWLEVVNGDEKTNINTVKKSSKKYKL